MTTGELSRIDRTAGPGGMQAWKACLGRHMLPGLEVVEPAEPGIEQPVEAHLVSSRLAQARLWSIRASAQRVRRQTSTSCAFMPVAILQISGTTRLEQGGRVCLLGPGTFAYLDAANPMQLDHLETFEQIYLQFPASAFRPATFQQAVSIAMNAGDPNDLPFFECARSVWAAAPTFDDEECRSALDAVLSLCNCTTAFRRVRNALSAASAGEPQLPVRVKRAMAFIEAHLGDQELGAQQVADSQGVSRRYLDELFAESGHRIQSWIWERRLTGAAEELVSRKHFPRKSLLQISLEHGFKSPSHFSRAFAKRFGQCPRAYRQSHDALAVA